MELNEVRPWTTTSDFNPHILTEYCEAYNHTKKTKKKEYLINECAEKILGNRYNALKWVQEQGIEDEFYQKLFLCQRAIIYLKTIKNKYIQPTWHIANEDKGYDIHIICGGIPKIDREIKINFALNLSEKDALITTNANKGVSKVLPALFTSGSSYVKFDWVNKHLYNRDGESEKLDTFDKEIQETLKPFKFKKFSLGCLENKFKKEFFRDLFTEQRPSFSSEDYLSLWDAYQDGNIETIEEFWNERYSKGDRKVLFTSYTEEYFNKIVQDVLPDHPSPIILMKPYYLLGKEGMIARFIQSGFSVERVF